jgi:3-oxoacyl-[acyl-carrier-protein] synthase III
MTQPYCGSQPLQVLGTGAALPGQAVTTAQLLQNIDQRFDLKLARRGGAAARRLGVESRHVARDLHARHETPRRGDSNAELAARAVLAALSRANRSMADIAYLIAHTATPGALLPPGAAKVAELLEYDGPFVELRQACTGFANALVLASAVLPNAQHGVVVVVGSETGSVYFDPVRAAEDDGQLINLLQMGDGAAAVVLGNESRGAHIAAHYVGQMGRNRASGFSLSAGGSEQIAAEAIHAEFTHDFAVIRRDGEQLFRAGIEAMTRLGVSLDSIDWIIPHQANGRMDALLSQALGWPRDRVFVNASRLGNTGSAAIWLAFDELRAQLMPGERVLVLGAEATKFMYGGFLYVHA